MLGQLERPLAWSLVSCIGLCSGSILRGAVYTDERGMLGFKGGLESSEKPFFGVEQLFAQSSSLETSS